MPSKSSFRSVLTDPPVVTDRKLPGLVIGMVGTFWITVGALATGLGMTAACSSYEGSGGCGGVFPAMALSWAVVGGLFGAALASSAWTDVSLRDDLRRFARFPQGAPPNAGWSVGDVQRGPRTR